MSSGCFMSAASASGVEFLLQKVQETDLENLRLKAKLQRFTVLEMTLRNLAKADMVARELLSVLEPPRPLSEEKRANGSDRVATRACQQALHGKPEDDARRLALDAPAKFAGPSGTPCSAGG